ncbi:2'-5' RNA ligase family protein [Schumannella luteola]|uniref:2'-5' RNA ligase n=1 Tax=Schumannella luteola TaxID=472059 RepID=A0A852YHL8_9MICO|nr:2'-5' RNA ligase family protein [Schumannella luteola]NYH00771.1 2'-5' RNA ligase [Schumannella luteola]TPW91720.1 2'-5' RNA ligase family protein [Schumannella luteola]
MVQSLELTLDAASDAAVRVEWDALAAAGLPSQAAHRHPSNRPHVTLLVRPAFDRPPLADPALAPVLAGLPLPLPLRLGAPVLFGRGERRVLARLVVPSAALLGLHGALHHAVRPGDDAPNTTPGEWTPHVTLARRIPLDRLGEALAVLDAADESGAVSLDGVAESLRHWDGDARIVTPLG